MLYFDIETEANIDVVEFMDEPTAPGNYKDPDKIAAYIEEKKQEQINGMALDADFGKIVAIAWKENHDAIDSRLVTGDYTEKELLQQFWSVYGKNRGISCGYNIIGFDLPYIMRRSFDLQVTPTIIPNLAKYRTSPTLDLMMVLYNWSGFKGLKFVAKRYGIPNPMPEMDGSKVKDMDSETLRAYVENDVDLVYQLYLRMSGVYF